MIVRGHGISLDVPSRWEARILRRSGTAPVLHIASFALEEGDGDFGAAATGRMRAGDVFAALVEYRIGGGLRPGQGLFAGRRPGVPQLADFGPHQLQVPRRDQLGWQSFFTEAGRPFCLYEVIQPSAAGPSVVSLIAGLAAVFSTLKLEGEPSRPG